MTDDTDPMFDWRTKMEAFCHRDAELKLLRDGPTSVHTAMLLTALKQRYKKIIGIND